MLNDALIRYIELRRSLGFKLRSQYVLLRNFVEYATANGDDFIRAERVLNWAILAPSAPQRRNRRLRCVDLRRHHGWKIRDMNFRRQMPWDEAGFGAGCHIWDLTKIRSNCYHKPESYEATNLYALME